MATKKPKKPAKPTNCLLIYKDKAGEWRWRAVARNGKTIADSGESYVSLSNVRRAAKAFYTWAAYRLPANAQRIQVDA